MLARAAARHYARHSAACTPANAASFFLQQARCEPIQKRSFLTNRAVTSYVMKRAKILQIVWRALAAYPEIHTITEPDAPIQRLFSRDSNIRERAFMYVLCLLPPDEAVDLPEFLRGAQDAAELVLKSVYTADRQQLDVLETFASPDCVAQWKQKREQVCRLLEVDDAASLHLESVKIKRVGASEIKYWFGDAKIGADAEKETKKDDLEPPSDANSAGESDETKKESHSIEESRPYSKFLSHEAMQLKVKFEVREHFKVERAEEPRSVVVDSTFEWAFESDVSRAELLDWVVTSALPFTSKVAENDDSEDDIATAIEDAA